MVFVYQMIRYCARNMYDLWVVYHKIISNGYMGIWVSDLICDLQKYFLCGSCTVSSEKLIKHIVPCRTDVNKLDTSPINFKQYRRSSLCEVLTLDTRKKCAKCDKFEEKHKSLVTKQQKILNVPAKLKAPVSQNSSIKIKACLAKRKIKMFLIRNGTCNNEE